MILSDFLSSPQSKKPFAAVLGHPVRHSWSPDIHNSALSYHRLDVLYHALDCPPDEWVLIPELLALPAFRGANVTIPLKEKIIDYLDETDHAAREIGAVNTIVPDRSNQIFIGHNTDAHGFLQPLKEETGLQSAVILGSGGASRAIRYALSRFGVQKIHIASRSYKKRDKLAFEPQETHFIAYDELEGALLQSDLLVNTTPVGMHPDHDSSPLAAEVLPCVNGKICYDIIYNPPETRLLKDARKHGARSIGGTEMFLHQAALSFQLWFGAKMPVELVRKVLLNMMHKT